MDVPIPKRFKDTAFKISPIGLPGGIFEGVFLTSPFVLYKGIPEGKKLLASFGTVEKYGLFLQTQFGLGGLRKQPADIRRPPVEAANFGLGGFEPPTP